MIRILQRAVQNKVSQELPFRDSFPKILPIPTNTSIYLAHSARWHVFCWSSATHLPKLKLLQIIFTACLVNVYLDLDHVKGIIGCTSTTMIAWSCEQQRHQRTLCNGSLIKKRSQSHLSITSFSSESASALMLRMNSAGLQWNRVGAAMIATWRFVKSLVPTFGSKSEFHAWRLLFYL